MSDKSRPASHAGSWYEGNPTALSHELDNYLAAVPDTIDGKRVPVSGARVIIAPHAGYSYSGPCAAWAYKCLDLSAARRIFVLGPSHTYYLRGCAVTTCSKYETPFGDLTVDTETLAAIKAAGSFSDIPLRSDVAEHSLEMHLPYLYKRLQQTFDDAAKFPPIVPILIGDNNLRAEKEVGKILAPYLLDPENAFIVSSDFCHWGRRFDYMVYSPAANEATMTELPRTARGVEGVPIHETIKLVDDLAMDAIRSGSHDAFYNNIKRTENTVCGRHPIGVMMAAMEEVAEGPMFQFVQYQRSGLVQEPSDSSVSYGSAYAVV